MSMFINAVSRLREERLSRSTRIFRARGSRIKRCPHCLLAQRFCICHAITPQSTHCQFCLLMYDTEPLKPSNTGRLIADILPETEAFLWSRVDPDPRLLNLLSSPKYAPYVVFPNEGNENRRVVTTPQQNDEKIPLFIILDGTWPEANKMFRKSPYLNNFPILSLTLENKTQYQLRVAPKQQQVCTAEIAIALLNLAGEKSASQHLAYYFDVFKQSYLAGKMNRNISTSA